MRPSAKSYAKRKLYYESPYYESHRYADKDAEHERAIREAKIARVVENEEALGGDDVD